MKAAFPLKTFLLLWLSHFAVDFYLGIWPIYKTIAQIDIAKAGLIMGIAGFSGEILQIAFGYFSDRGLRKKILLFGLLMTAVISFVTFTANLYLLFALMMCLMIGSGAFHPAAVGVASSLLPIKRRAILIFTTGGALGLGISQIAFSKALDFFGGHAFPLTLPALLLLPFLLRHELPSLKIHRPPLREIFHPIFQERRRLGLLYLAQVTSYGVLLSFIFLLPDILQAKGAHPWLFKGGGHMSFIFGAFIGMVLLGFLSHRLSLKSALLGTSFSALILLFTLLLFPSFSTSWTILLLAATGASLYLINPLIISWGNQLVPESPSTVSALLMGFAWCLSNVFPAVAGALAQTVTLSSPLRAMEIIALVLALSFCLIAFIPSQEEPAPAAFNAME